MASDPTPTRRRYTGSCHCGKVKYVTYLILPYTAPALDHPGLPHPEGQHTLYKDNCTACLKTGLTLLRLIDAANDFMLLSPAQDPLAPGSGMTNYQCNAKWLNWPFCATCGVRCFIYAGDFEVAKKDIGDGTVAEVWSPVKGYEEGWGKGYLGLNPMTIDAGQGLDMRDWVDNKKIIYFDMANFGSDTMGGPSYAPYAGGMY